MKTVSVIGHGQIGSALVDGVAGLADWHVGQVLTRRPVRDLNVAQTCEVAAFLAHPADLIIDAAGPDALREVGPAALARAPVWSVGAVAMADPALRAQIASVSANTGHTLRLFACGMANMPLSAQHLAITMRAPEIEEDWEGPLTRAVGRWPHRLNTAVAAALNGPGLEATDLTLQRGRPGTLPEIEVRAKVDGIAWQRSIQFEITPHTPHPVARMLLSELARARRPWQGV